MAQTLVKIIADISTTLTTKVAVGATSATLTSGLDSDGVQIPTGTYGFTIDRNNSQKEYFTATLTGAALTNIENVTRGTGVGTAGFVREHRKGAEVIISDWVSLKRMLNLLDGTTNFDASTPLEYDGTATISTANQLATKAYVDGVAIAGGADSSTSVKGIGKVSVAPVSAATPIFVGDNDGRVPTQDENNALVGNNTDIAVGTGNTFVTQTGLQHNAEKYAADAGANDTYVITLSPIPTSYTTGMVVHFKANTANTGTATLNVNSLGAKTIVKEISSTLIDGDIQAGQFCTLIYDGTNFVLQNPNYNTNKIVVASDNLKISADTERTTTSATFTLKKSITVNNPGVYRIKFDIKTTSSNCYADLRTGGISYATALQLTTDATSSTSYVTKTNDLYLPAGTKIDLYLAGNPDINYVRNFRVYYDLATFSTGTVVTD